MTKAKTTTDRIRPPPPAPNLVPAETPAEATKRHKLSVRDSQRVMNLLDLHCRVDAGGFAVYVEGWDDARVAAEAIPDYPGNGATAVANRRTEFIGPLRKAGASSACGCHAELIEIRDRLAALEAKVAA